MSKPKRLRVTREDRKTLKELSKKEEFQERVGDDKPTYQDSLKEILPLPNEDTIIERPEEDMVFVNIEKDVHERAHELAGENVPAHRVVRHYLHLYLNNNPEMMDDD